MNRKVLFLIFITLILDFGIIQSQWIMEKCPTLNNLNAIYFLDNNSAWIVGNEGTILSKYDSRWIEYPKVTQKDLHSVFMVDHNNGWAVGENGTIVHYDGSGWKIIENPASNNLFSVFFKDPQTGIAVGENGTILVYKDSEWIMVENETHANLYSGVLVNDEILIGGGLEFAGIPIMTMHGNEKKLNSVFDPIAEISGIYFISPENGWAVGSSGTIVHFDGNQWLRIEHQLNVPTLKSVFFSDNNNGISVGLNGTLLTFSDNMWAKENSLIKSNLNGTAITENKYYAVGDSGIIIMKKFKEDIKVEPQLTHKEGKVELYPNPCNDILNINVKLPYAYHSVMLSITSEDGQLLYTNLFSLENGNLSYPINISVLKPGFYLLKVASGNYSSTNKFIVRKQ